MIRQVLLICLLISLAAKSTRASQICSLCGSPYLFPKRWDYPVITNVSPWKTCRDLFFEIAAMSKFSSQCSSMQNAYSAVCCNDQLPPGWDIPPTPAPVISVGTGNEPNCDICGNDEYPGKPDVFIVARYVGEYPCGTLYHRGRNGLVPGFMCGPLQDYVYEKCGCGEHNPNGGGNGNDLGGGGGGTQDPGCTTIPGWVDETGTSCAWYEQNDSEGCPQWGWYPGVGGATASQACCHCSSDCDNVNGWKDDSGTGCDWYQNNEPPGCPNWWWYPGNGNKNAHDACCHCKNDNCNDEPGWADVTGTSCSWYENNEPRGCPQWSWYPGANGKSAGEACCHCQCQNNSGWADTFGRTCTWYEQNDSEGCPSTGNNKSSDNIKAKKACCHCKSS